MGKKRMGVKKYKPAWKKQNTVEIARQEIGFILESIKGEINATKKTAEEGDIKEKERLQDLFFRQRKFREMENILISDKVPMQHKLRIIATNEQLGPRQEGYIARRFTPKTLDELKEKAKSLGLKQSAEDEFMGMINGRKIHIKAYQFDSNGVVLRIHEDIVLGMGPRLTTKGKIPRVVHKAMVPRKEIMQLLYEKIGRLRM